MKRFSYKKFLKQHYPKEKLKKILEDDKNLVLFTELGKTLIPFLDIIEKSTTRKAQLLEILSSEFEHFKEASNYDELLDKRVYEYYIILIQEFKKHYDRY